MSKHLLLISNSTNPGHGYLEHCEAELWETFEGRTEIVFIPYALADHDGYSDLAESRFEAIGLRLRSAHRHPRPAEAVTAADGVFVGGGNTFRLLHRVRAFGLIEAIRSVIDRGAPYAGASAGCNLACPTIKTTNDMPIVDPEGFDALDLIPYQVNPHYVDRDPDVAHGGETREQRIAEFHEENDTPVIGLREGSLLRHIGGITTLHGDREARLFRRGRDPLEMSPGAVIEDIVAPI
jgi:dipeptidase E